MLARYGELRQFARCTTAALRITATQRETNAQFKATTTESGRFVLPSLPIGASRVLIDRFKAEFGRAGGGVISAWSEPRQTRQEGSSSP